MPNPYFTEYSELLARLFPGLKVQKLSIDAGFQCPNRDGSIGTGGCTYCDNRTFVPSYCRRGDSVSLQLQAGKRFFARKYPQMKYLAYFQAYTSTYSSEQQLLSLYEEALADEDVVGMVVGTRPDCLSDSLLEDLEHLDRKKRVLLEFGAESSHDRTLRLVNRGHTWACTVDAVRRASERGLSCGLHLIAGLPGETEADLLQTVERACELPIDTIKLHQLQIVKGTELHRQWLQDPSFVVPLQFEQYLQTCAKVVEMVPRRISIDRFLSQAPPHMVAAPSWGIKNYEFTARLLNFLRTKG